MINPIHKRILVLLGVVTVLAASVGLTGQVIVSAANGVKTLDRELEPVVIEGHQVNQLVGTPVDHLFVYTYTATQWGDQIPVQVDEVTLSGNYTTTEDNLLDANDEIVFMAGDLGDRAPEPALLTMPSPISSTWYEIEVTDPLSSTKKGWAYLVRSSQVAPTVTDDYASTMAAAERITITTGQYVLGLPTAYEGIDYLALNPGGSTEDLLDRTKLRVVLATILGTTTVTEQSLLNPQIAIVIDGPVRVVLKRTVYRDATPIVEMNLTNTYKAYHSLLQTSSTAGFVLGSGTGLAGFRSSVDLESAVSGQATFYNANISGGVAIDGVPDTVAEQPLSYWGQISHPTGRLIQVTDPGPAGGTATNFYRDDSSPEISFPTGEGGSYGESGLWFKDNLNQSFTLQSSLFIVPTTTVAADNVGSTYNTYHFNPLQIVARLQGKPPVYYLPVICKNN